jgi:hypothetical protein
MSAVITRDRPLLVSPEQNAPTADRHSELEECATLARISPLVWEIQKREQQHCTALPFLTENPWECRRPLSDRSEVGPVRAQRPVQWKTALPADGPHFTPLRWAVAWAAEGEAEAKATAA